MRLLAADVKREFGVQVQVRVGINSGPVVVMVKAHGENVSVDYRAVGRTTHVAARLQGIGSTGTTLLTRDTFALAKGFIRRCL